MLSRPGTRQGRWSFPSLLGRPRQDTCRAGQALARHIPQKHRMTLSLSLYIVVKCQLFFFYFLTILGSLSMYPVKQSRMVIIEHMRRRREPHRPKSLLVLAYRSNLFGNKHPFITLLLQSTIIHFCASIKSYLN